MLHNQLVTWMTATGAQAGSRWSSVQTLQVAPLWCDLGFFPNSRGNKAAANLRPIMIALACCWSLQELRGINAMWSREYTCFYARIFSVGKEKKSVILLRRSHIIPLKRK